MKTWVRKSLSVGVLAAGAVLFSGGAAMAESAPTTSDNYGVGDGAQVLAPIQAPVNLCGNSVTGAAGVAFAECTGGASAEGAKAPDMSTSDNYGVGNGLQVFAPITAPLNLCGNGVSGVGSAAFAGCEGGAETGPGGTGSGGYGEEAGRANRSARAAAAQQMMTSGNYGVLNGVQVFAPIQAPIDACGLSVAGVGAASFASCEGGATAESARTESAALTTSDNYGTLNGVQVFAPVKLPVDISGNAISGVAGAAFAESNGGATAGKSAGGSSAKAKRNSGEALPVVDSLPVNNLIGALGGATGADRSARGTEAAGAGHLTTSDNYGTANGIQIWAPIKAAVNASGNALSGVGGAAFASSTGGARTK